MTPVDFWFDPVSPYAYLAFERLPEAFAGLSYSVAYRPIVFGALLKAFAHKGPAEIEPKRAWTFRQVHWLGHRAGIPIDTPARHPFNPLACRASPGPPRPSAARRAGSSASRCCATSGAAAPTPRIRSAWPRSPPSSRRASIRRSDAQQAAPARCDRRGARARRLRRAHARHRRQAVLGLRRPRHGRRVGARRPVVRRRRTGNAKARRGPGVKRS